MPRRITWADEQEETVSDEEYLFENDSPREVSEPPPPLPVYAQIQFTDVYGHRNVSTITRKIGSDWWRECTTNNFDNRSFLNHMYPPHTHIDQLIEWISLQNRFVSLLSATYENESYST